MKKHKKKKKEKEKRKKKNKISFPWPQKFPLIYLLELFKEESLTASNREKNHGIRKLSTSPSSIFSLSSSSCCKM
jgi:hypothetical protein